MDESDPDRWNPDPDAPEAAPSGGARPGDVPSGDVPPDAEPLGDMPSDDVSPDAEPAADLPAVRYWPPYEQADPANSLATQCTGCGAPWRVHRDMAGFRLRCTCGTYVQVPRLPEPSPAARIDALTPYDGSRDLALAPEITEDDEGRLQVASKRGEVIEREMPTSAPMAPGTVLHGNNPNAACTGCPPQCFTISLQRIKKSGPHLRSGESCAYRVPTPPRAP